LINREKVGLQADFSFMLLQDSYPQAFDPTFFHPITCPLFSFALHPIVGRKKELLLLGTGRVCQQLLGSKFSKSNIVNFRHLTLLGM